MHLAILKAIVSSFKLRESKERTATPRHHQRPASTNAPRPSAPTKATVARPRARLAAVQERKLQEKERKLCQEKPFAPMAQARAPYHVVTRSQANPKYPGRQRVPDMSVPWGAAWASYAPPDYTHPVVFANDRTVLKGGWADPKALDAVDFTERKTCVHAD